MRTPRGTQVVHKGITNLEKQLRRRKYQQLWTYMGRLYDLGVRKGGTILLCGYAEGYNFDFGVSEY